MPMNYAELPLPPALDGLVAAVWTLGADSDDWLKHEAVPDGCIELIRRHSGRSVWRTEQPALFATGLAHTPAKIRFSGDSKFTAIKMWPWTWHALGGAPCADFADDWIEIDDRSPLGALLEGDVPANLATVLTGIATPLGRAVLASQSVAEIASRAGLNHRRLQRIFSRELGMSPRAYLRLLRFRGAMIGIQQAGETLAGTAAAQGYSDQSHMTREFRSLAGVPPRYARARACGPFLEASRPIAAEQREVSFF